MARIRFAKKDNSTRSIMPQILDIASNEEDPPTTDLDISPRTLSLLPSELPLPSPDDHRDIPSSSALPSDRDILYSRYFTVKQVQQSRLIGHLRSEKPTTSEAGVENENENKNENENENEDEDETDKREDGIKVEEAKAERGPPASVLDIHHPHLRSGARQIHSMTSVQQITEAFISEASTWQSWEALPTITFGSAFSRTTAAPRIEWKTFGKLNQNCYRATSKQNQGKAEVLPRADFPGWIKLAADLLGGRHIDQANCVLAIANVATTLEEFDTLVASSLKDHFEKPGDYPTVAALQKKAFGILEIDPKFKRDLPNLATQLATLLLINHNKDYNSTSHETSLPLLFDPSSSSTPTSRRRFAVSELLIGTFEILMNVTTSLGTSGGYVEDFVAYNKSTVSVASSVSGAWTLSFPRDRSQSGSVCMSVPREPIPAPPSSLPLLTFPHRPSAPADNESRLRLFRPDLPEFYVDQVTKMVGWLNVTLAENGVTELPEISPQLTSLWSTIREKYRKQSIPNTNYRHVLYSARFGANWQIYRGSTVDSEAERGVVFTVGKLENETLAKDAAQRGSQVILRGGNSRDAERAMAMFVDVSLRIMGQDEADRLLNNAYSSFEDKLATCASCNTVRDIDEFPKFGRNRVNQRVEFFSPIICELCDPRASEEAFAPRFSAFKSLRSMKAEDGVPVIETTPESLAQAYHDRNGYDFETGMGFDAYTKVPLNISADDSSNLASFDCVGLIPLSHDPASVFGKHNEDRNNVPTMLPTNLAMQDRNRHHADLVTSLVPLVTIAHHLKQKKSPSETDRQLAQKVDLLIEHCRNAFDKLWNEERSQALYRQRRKKGTETAVGDVLGNLDPRKTFLGIINHLDQFSSLSIKPNPNLVLPGSLAFYQQVFDEFGDITEDDIATATAEAASLSSPYKFDMPVEMFRGKTGDGFEPDRFLKLVAELENDTELFPDCVDGGFKFPRLQDGFPSFVTTKEKEDYETEYGKPLTFTVLLRMGYIRYLRMLEECDVNYREAPDADVLEGLFTNFVTDLYVQVRLREDQDILLGQLYMLAVHHPRGGGVGHLQQGKPMKLGATVPRPTSFRTGYDLALRNTHRRSYYFTRWFNVAIQQLSQSDRRIAMNNYLVSLGGMLEDHRFVGFADDLQDEIAHGVELVRREEGFDLFGPWTARGLVAAD